MSLCIDRPAVGVLRLLINRPDKRNAIDHGVREQLLQALDEARRDPQCRAILIGGVGGHLSAGGDIGSMEGLDEAGARARMQHIHRLCEALYQYPLPVVVAAQGVCAGAGAGLALLADAVLAGPDSKLLFPFLKLGLAPDWGLLRSLPARVGLGRARRILLGGQAFSGEQALAEGLVDECVTGDVMAMAVERAQQLAALPGEAFARMKTRLNNPALSFAAELKREEDDQAVLLLGADFAEGFAAFQEKRTPHFLRVGVKA